eukprot:6461246-Amphidinium_carterae.4
MICNVKTWWCQKCVLGGQANMSSRLGDCRMGGCSHSVPKTEENMSSRLGVRQRLAAAEAREARGARPSKLAKLLLEQWSWGHISAISLQAIAAAAEDDGCSHPDVSRLAGIGSRGVQAGNCSRDLQAIVSVGVLHAALYTVSLPVAGKVCLLNSHSMTSDPSLTDDTFSWVRLILAHSLTQRCMNTTGASLWNFGVALKP